jgi:hypothetical protein
MLIVCSESQFPDRSSNRHFFSEYNENSSKAAPKGFLLWKTGEFSICFANYSIGSVGSINFKLGNIVDVLCAFERATINLGPQRGKTLHFLGYS